MPSAPADSDARPAEPSASPEDVVYAARGPVPGTEDEEVALELAADHTIWVDRPEAWSGFHVAAPDRYRWEGGVPDPDAPGVPEPGPYTADDRAWRDPVAAAARAQTSNRRLGSSAQSEAQRVWRELWQQLAPHLDARAAKLAVRYGYTAELYQLLANRFDLCDHLEVCPALGPFLTRERAEQVPAKGWSLDEIAGFLISPDPEEPLELSPGFMVWAKELDWDPAKLPLFPRGEDERLEAMRGFVRQAARLGKRIDHNGVYKIESDDEWLLLNLAIGDPTLEDVVPTILKNPSSAVNRVSKYFPPAMNLNRRERAEQVLDATREWLRRNPEVLERVDTFSGLAKRARKWDRRMRHAEYEQEQAIAEWKAAREAAREERRRRAVEEARRLAEEAAERGSRWRLKATIDPAEEFPDLPPEGERVYQEDGRIMLLIDTPLELQRESLLMNHCVVNYAERCLEGKIRILSVREVDEDGEVQPVATVEVTTSTGHIRQQRGVRNRGLDDDTRRWIKKAVAELGIGRSRTR